MNLHKSAELMRSGEEKSFVAWLLKQLMRLMPGRMTEWFINRSTKRITQAANAIRFKGSSSFFEIKRSSRRWIASPPFFSIMASISGVGKNQLELNASADWVTHVVSAPIKIGIGMIGGIMVGLGVQASVLLSFAASTRNDPNLVPFTVGPLTLAICMVAGISERLVLGFVERVLTIGSKQDGNT